MANTDMGEAPNTRKSVSKRGFIDENGNAVEKMEEAAGASYTLLGEGGKTFTRLFGEPGKADTMFAIFGFHTKIGNVANTVLNDKNEPGSPADAAAAIDDFIADTESGTWAVREGGVGVKIDKDALAAAYVEFCASKGQTKDLAVVREALEDKPVLVRQLRAVPEIAKLYADRVGKPVKSTEEIVGLI